MPVLSTLEKEFAAEGLVVLTVCMGVSAEEARQALRKANVHLLTLVDEDAETASPYRAYSIPATYLIDHVGLIVMGRTGYEDSTEANLRAEIQHLLED